MQTKIIAGHQPNFFPWFGYFEKILKSDLFVYSDDVQYPKQCFVNRVEILIDGAPKQLTLPVIKGNDEAIYHKRFVQDKKTLKRIQNSIAINYGGFPFFDDLGPILSEFNEKYWEFSSISELNIHMNNFIASALSISTPTMTGMELGLDKYHQTERLIHRCKLLEASSYLSGSGGKNYQDEDMFKSNGVDLIYLDYELGKKIFGDWLPYSVLIGIAALGLSYIRTEIEQWVDSNG